MEQIREGAGFIIARKIKGNYKFLSLIYNGKYDLPKGMIEDGESYLEAAIRECHEESNILVRESDMIWGLDYCYSSSIAIYLATTNQSPCVLPNPVSGIKEHDYYEWCDPYELESKCISYLKESISWAIKKIGI